jgi:SP family arabinose:H+ symporter-like MFS transporter
MIGSLLGIIIAWGIACHLPGEIAWRVIVATSALGSLLFLLLSWRLPASPRWLVACGRSDEARIILTRLNGDSAESILADIQHALQETTASLKELLLPAVRPMLLVGIVLALLNNWTGWSAVCTYLPTIFQRAGYPDPSKAVGMTIIPTAIGLVFTLFAVALIDRIGRRPLWIATSAMMAAFLILLGFVFHRHIGGPLIIGVTILVSLPHMIGLGPLPWLMMSEIFPNHLRARAVSVCTAMLWAGSFVAIGLFPKAMAVSTRLIGSAAGTCWVLAGICLFSLLFGVRWLPETRGRSLEEIAAGWKKQVDISG